MVCPPGRFCYLVKSINCAMHPRYVLFGVDEMPDSQISENAGKVAAQVVEEYFQ